MEPDVIAGAIEVLRESSLLTYENRRISTGVLLLGCGARHCCIRGRRGRPRPCPYNSDLIGVKSFHRLCDGIKTVFLVNQGGCCWT